VPPRPNGATATTKNEHAITLSSTKLLADAIAGSNAGSTVGKLLVARSCGEDLVSAFI
jgi:hypothetical protein